MTSPYSTPPSRAYHKLAAVCLIIALVCGVCFTGLAPDDAGKGETGAIVMGVIFLAAAAYFYMKRGRGLS